jgi:phage terminase large subunit-like protein
MAQVQELASSLGISWTLADGCPGTMIVYTNGDDGKSIVSIERIPNEPSKCIAIDNPSHLYLVGRNYTATHNTALMSALCLYHLTSDGEPGAEVYNCATSEAQARKCYGSADAMRELSPFLNKRIRRGMAQKTGKSALNYDKNGSILVALAANPKKKDGLSASAVIYDELAAAEDNGALFEQLEESMAARRQPMMWIISSENTIRDGIWDERMAYGQGVLNGTIHDNRMLPLLYIQDDRSEIKNESLWVKSNPGIDEIKDRDRLKHRVLQCESSPRRWPSVLTKDFCLRSGSYSAFLDIESCINTTEIDFNIIGIPDYVCVGFDLASKNDLCACVIRWKADGDDRIYEMAKFWVASEAIRLGTDDNQKDKVPYNFWSERGQPMDGTIWHYVDIVEGDRVNFSCVMDFLNDLVSVGMYPFCVAYDPWHIGDLEEKMLQRTVGEARTFPVPQSARVISPLMREHELDLKAHRVICPNPCLHHNRSSVQARTDNNDNVFPQKKDLDQNNKIDGFMAELFSLAAYNKFKDQYLAAIDWKPPEGTGDEETTDPDKE